MKKELLNENAQVGHSYLSEPEIKPASIVAEHIREVLQLVLGLSDENINILIKAEAVEVSDLASA